MLHKNDLKNLYLNRTKKFFNDFNYPQLATVIHAALIGYNYIVLLDA
jgi:hypothetical protein